MIIISQIDLERVRFLLNIVHRLQSSSMSLLALVNGITLAIVILTLSQKA